MREFRIRVPDLADGKRLVSAGREKLKNFERPEIPVHLLDAHNLVKETNSRLLAAQEDLQRQHDETQASLQALGEAELGAFDGPIREFSSIFGRLKNVEITDVVTEELPDAVRDFDIDICDVDFGAVDALKASVLGGGAGAAAGLTAFGAVGTLATASTGTAIAGLSGAAATNATLAWLGGGAIASGGGGMAAGAMVLGGIVALPVLAVGGLVVHHKGREALAKAKQDSLRADEAIAEMELAATRAGAIQRRADRVCHLVTRLGRLAGQRNAVLSHQVSRNNDYATYDEHDREAVMLSVSVVKTLRAVMDVPVIDDDGLLTTDSTEMVEAAEEFLAKAAGGR